jgi:hypothetical protein
MKAYLRNLVIGLPLAFGAMLTFIAVVMALHNSSDLFPSFVTGLIGIPLLFASLAHVFDAE